MLEINLVDMVSAKLTDGEIEQVQSMLANPTVQKYFKIVHFNAMRDVTENKVDSPEEEEIFLSRYKRFLGVQQICALIESFANKKG